MGLFVWEEFLVLQLTEVLLGSSPISESEDRWVWKDSISEEFSIQSTYDFLKGEAEGGNSRLYDFFWKIKALPLAQVIAWRVIENMLAARVKLERCGLEIESNLFCVGV